MSVPRPLTPRDEGVCYSEDEAMQRRLMRKRQLEESEIYNAPETMAVKRRAVKEAAKTTPVPKKMTNLTFDDHIEPSEAPDAPELENEWGEGGLHAAEKGSNAAQSGVGVVGREEGEGEGRDVDMDVDVDVVASIEVEPVLQQNDLVAARMVEPQVKPQVKPRVQPTLPLVLLDPQKWAQKSDQAARRSRRRLRRLLQEEQALLSSQLQVA